MVYEFHHDAGHGWLKVPIAELQSLGIWNRISGYSYYDPDGENVYLEEDCDASLFIKTRKEQGNPITIVERDDGDNSYIRELEHVL